MTKKAPVNQLLHKDEKTGIETWMKRLDQLDLANSGNKLYKLHYNLKEAKRLNHHTLLTFGGAYSNHIAATATMGKQDGFKTIGIIRGRELGQNLPQTLKTNPTLRTAHQKGMKLAFITRKAYREKLDPAFLKILQEKYGKFYFLPEGGTNRLAVRGCREILQKTDTPFDYICCPVGTGGTLAGIIKASSRDQTILGFSALNANLTKTIRNFTEKTNYEIFPESDFGGFAKLNQPLVHFINQFTESHRIVLDPVYTGKMMFNLVNRLKNGYFEENSRILVIHTGGLQGIKGMNQRLNQKGLPLIKY